MKILILSILMSVSALAYADVPNILFVDSDSGSDANSCSANSPCKTVLMALSKVTVHTQAIVVDDIMYRCGRGGVCNPPIKL